MDTKAPDNLINDPNGLAGPAPCLDYMNGIWSGEIKTGDFHAVHGMQAKSDGGLYAAGSGTVWGRDQDREGVIVKVMECPTQTKKYSEWGPNQEGCNQYAWVAKFAIPGKKVEANWVAESPDGSYIIGVGFEENEEGMPDQAVWKLDAKTGALIWTYKFNSGYSDGLETVAFAPDGSLYVGGFAGASIPASDLRFKSAGQVLEGRPFVGKISAEDANGSSAPIGYEWLKHFGGDGYKGSAKALRVEAGTGNIVAVAGSRAAVLKFSPAGDVLMKTGELEPNMQVMDIDVHPDGGYMLGGLRFAPEIAATMLKVGPDGTKQWVKTYGNYPGGLN